MWRPIRKGELRYMRHMEERVWKQKIWEGLLWAILGLWFVLLLTAVEKSDQEEQLENDYVSVAFVEGAAGHGNKEDGRERLAEVQRGLNTTFYWIFGLECMAAVGGFIWWGYSDRKKINEILNGPLLAQTAVCTGKREYHNRSLLRVFLNIKTQSGETLRDIRVPWLIGRKLDCDMPVLAVLYTLTGEEGKEEKHYKLYPLHKHL